MFEIDESSKDFSLLDSSSRDEGEKDSLVDVVIELEETDTHTNATNKGEQGLLIRRTE